LKRKKRKGNMRICFVKNVLQNKIMCSLAARVKLGGKLFNESPLETQALPWMKDGQLRNVRKLNKGTHPLLCTGDPYYGLYKTLLIS